MTKHGFKNLTGTVWIIERRMQMIEEKIRGLDFHFAQIIEEYEYEYEFKAFDKERIGLMMEELLHLVQEFKATIAEVKAS